MSCTLISILYCMKSVHNGTEAILIKLFDSLSVRLFDDIYIEISHYYLKYIIFICHVYLRKSGWVKLSSAIYPLHILFFFCYTSNFPPIYLLVIVVYSFSVFHEGRELDRICWLVYSLWFGSQLVLLTDSVTCVGIMLKHRVIWLK